MGDVLTLGNLLVGTGVSGVVIAIIGAIVGRRLNSANYSKIISELSTNIAKDLRADNLKVKQDVQHLEDEIDKLKERITALIEQLNIAIPLLEAADVDRETTVQMRKVLRERRRERRERDA